MGVSMHATDTDESYGPVTLNRKRELEIRRKAALAQHIPARLYFEKARKQVGITLHATDSVEYEPGIYRAKLQKFEEEESQFTDERTGEPKWQYIWTFELLEEGFEGHTLRGWSSTAFGPQSKARAWVEALVGRQIQSGENISGDDLIGKECDLMVTPKTTDRGTFARIDSVQPVRKKKGKNKEKPAEEPGEVQTDESDFEDIPF